MDGSFSFPVSDGSGENREGRREALQLLEAAGYRLSDGKLVNAATGEPVVIEILAATRAQERLLLTYAQALKQVGIEAKIRQVDSAQYQRRKQTYDFDMIQYSWPVSLSPGNEQSFRWGSEAAVTEGSFNYPGIKSPAAVRRPARSSGIRPTPRGSSRLSCCGVSAGLPAVSRRLPLALQQLLQLARRAIPEKKLRASFSRPSLDEIVAFRAHVDQAMERVPLRSPSMRKPSRRIVLGLEPRAAAPGTRR